jgi:hypothetical protein
MWARVLRVLQLRHRMPMLQVGQRTVNCAMAMNSSLCGIAGRQVHTVLLKAHHGAASRAGRAGRPTPGDRRRPGRTGMRSKVGWAPRRARTRARTRRARDRGVGIQGALVSVKRGAGWRSYRSGPSITHVPVQALSNNHPHLFCMLQEVSLLQSKPYAPHGSPLPSQLRVITSQ